VERAVSEFGEVAGPLVNNAARHAFGSLIDQGIAGFRKVVDVNLLGTFIPAWIVGRQMVARRSGVIVNLTSINAITPRPNTGAYPTTKAAVAKLTEQMALEWGPAGVRVNSVAPGFIDAGISAPFYADPEIRKQRGGRVPLQRLGAAEDIAAAVLFLASDEASYINGHQLVVDGGVVHSLLAQMPLPAANTANPAVASAIANSSQGDGAKLDLASQLDQCRTVALQLLRADPTDAAECRQRARPLTGDFGERLVVQDHEGGDGLAPRFGKAPGPEAFEQCGVLGAEAATHSNGRARSARRRALASDDAPHGNPLLAFQDRAARFRELQRAMRLVVDARQSQSDQLPEDAAPRGFIEIGADPEHRQLVVVPSGDSFAGLAAQHIDEMHGAEALAGAVDRGKGFLRWSGRIKGFGRFEAGVAVAAGCARSPK
jgi:short-subunit dehydrogenase